jgi:hypothetical protein
MQSFIFLSLLKCLCLTLLLLKLDSIFISKVSTMLTSTTYLGASINPLLLLFICNVNAFGLRMKWTSSVIRHSGGVGRLTRAPVGQILKFYEGEPLLAKIFQFFKAEPLSAGRRKPLLEFFFQFYKGEPLLAKVSTQSCKFYASWCQRKSFFFKYLNAAPVTDLV